MKVNGIELNVGDKILVVKQYSRWGSVWNWLLTALRIRKHSDNGDYTVTSAGTGATPFSNDDMAVSEAIDELLEWMASDNGNPVEDLGTNDKNLSALENGLRRMRFDGFEFSDSNLCELATGEESERNEAFSHFDGYAEVCEALDDIFDGYPEPEKVTDIAIEYDSDYGVNHRRGWTLKINGRVVVEFVSFSRMVWAYIKHRKLTMELVKYNDPVLYQIADGVMADEDVSETINGMLAIMKERKGECVGLAAPQVGISKCIIVVDDSAGVDPKKIRVMINPTIVAAGRYTRDAEACLSLPLVRHSVERAQVITVSYRTPEGEQKTETFRYFESRIIEHEVDHLFGRTLLNHMKPAAKMKAMETLRLGRKV